MKNDISTKYQFTDLRAHILPTIAAAQGIEDASDILALLKASGVDRVVATVDFYPGRVPYGAYLQMIRRAKENLAAVRLKSAPEVFACAELELGGGIEYMHELRDFAVSGTELLMVKLPRKKWDNEVLDTLSALRFAGFNILLADVGAYQPEAIEDLFAIGYRGQLDISDIATFNFRCRKRALEWIDSGFVVALGTGLVGCEFADLKKSANALYRAGRILGESRIARLSDQADVLLANAQKIN